MVGNTFSIAHLHTGGAHGGWGVGQCLPGAHLQGVRIFGQILSWFERQNSWWPGWVSFLLLFIAAVTLFLPGVALILGAGYVFGCAS